MRGPLEKETPDNTGCPLYLPVLHSWSARQPQGCIHLDPPSATVPDPPARPRSPRKLGKLVDPVITTSFLDKTRQPRPQWTMLRLSSGPSRAPIGMQLSPP